MARSLPRNGLRRGCCRDIETDGTVPKGAPTKHCAIRIKARMSGTRCGSRDRREALAFCGYRVYEYAVEPAPVAPEHVAVRVNQKVAAAPVRELVWSGSGLGVLHVRVGELHVRLPEMRVRGGTRKSTRIWRVCNVTPCVAMRTYTIASDTSAGTSKSLQSRGRPYTARSSSGTSSSSTIPR